jgi:hypothetical protein
MYATLARVAATLALVLVIIPAAAAGHTTWKPGTSYFIAENNATDTLKQRYDFAFCSGVRRLGHSTALDFELFAYFDCSTKLNAYRCNDRWHAVKDTKQFTYLLKRVGPPNCFVTGIPAHVSG